jgi:hypothetical protein
MINLDRTTATRRAPIDSLRKTALIAGVINLITKDSLTVGGPASGHPDRVRLSGLLWITVGRTMPLLAR